MKKYNYLLLPLFWVLFSGCLSVKVSDRHPNNPLATKLPPLQVDFDMNSFYSTYGVRKTIDIKKTEATTRERDFNKDNNSQPGQGTAYNESVTNIRTSPAVHADRKIKLIQDLFEYEVNNNICSSFGKTKGRIECKMILARTITGGDLYKVLSCTGGFDVVKLIRFPHHTCEAEMELQVSIYDEKGSHVATYNSNYQKANVYVACWWGYNTVTGLEKVRYKVFNKCMDSVKAQINKDYDTIIKALE